MSAAKRQKPRPRIPIDETRHSGIVRGPVSHVHPAIKAAGCEFQYDHRIHAYKIPKQAIDKVAAALELAGCVVEFRSGAMLW
ncbi:MAG: hypothetical protein M3N95_04860 [Actinomycetota bacterium]|nr:hypothetical protein [Actinomycetota bacterium]